MKKQGKVIISLVVAVAVILLAVSLFFPSVYKGLTSGTFGKADKYHRAQMSEKDVQLRSEFTRDTAQLKSMIQGLIYFSLFTMDLSNKIDSCVGVFQEHGICSQPSGCDKMNILMDYSDFIKNNNRTLGSTISMLTGFYLKDESDQSADIEKNLREFGNYVNNLNEKDSVLEEALHSMDNFMITNKTLRARKTELTQLKSIRDQLLVKGIQLSGVLQDKELSMSLLDYALSSQQDLKIVIDAVQLGKASAGSSATLDMIKSSEQSLGALMNNQDLRSVTFDMQITVCSAEQLQEIIQAQQVNAVASQKVESHQLESASMGSQQVSAMMLYNSSTMQFIVKSASTLDNQLSSALSASIIQRNQDIIGVAICSAQELNLVLSSFPLSSVLQSQTLGSMLNSAQLSNILSSQQELSSICFGSNFVAMSQQFGYVMGLNLQEQ